MKPTPERIAEIKALYERMACDPALLRMETRFPDRYSVNETGRDVINSFPEVLNYIDDLEGWKREALTVESWWAKIDEAIRRRPGSLGRSVAAVALELIQQRDEAVEWLQRLQRDTQTLTCVYCGKEYPPGSPTHGAAVLTEHIRICEKHPMRAIEADRERLYRALFLYHRDATVGRTNAAQLGLLEAFDAAVEALVATESSTRPPGWKS